MFFFFRLFDRFLLLRFKSYLEAGAPACSLDVISVQLSQDLLVKGWTAGLRDTNLKLCTDAVNALSSSIKCMFSLTDALDTHRGLHGDTVANGPLDDSKVDTLLLARIQALIEGLRVKQVTIQADCEALQVRALTLSFRLGSDSFVCLTQLLDVSVVRGELTVSCDHSVADLHGHVVLLCKRSAEIAADDSLNEWHKFATEVIGCFSGHLSRQVVHAREENVMLRHVIDRLLELA